MPIRIVRLAWLAICVLPLVDAGRSQALNQKGKEPALIEGRLIVEDNAGFFSPEAIKKAKAILAEVRDHRHREMQVLSMRELSESKQKEWDKLADTAAKDHFMIELAREEARASKARGVFVLICRKPHEIIVLCDRETKEKGFAVSDELRVRDAFLEKFREASKLAKDEEKQALRDKGLLNATEYVRDAYKKMIR